MRITIKSETVHGEERKGANGPYAVHWQDALFQGAEETFKVRVPVDGPGKAYPAGDYTFSSASFVRNKYQSLELGRLVLEPLKLAAK